MSPKFLILTGHAGQSRGCLAHTPEEIKEQVELRAVEQFVLLNEPELFWPEIGLEYIGKEVTIWIKN